MVIMEILDQKPHTAAPRPVPHAPPHPPAELWNEPSMRAALRRQDLATVFHRLARLGYSQRGIAALTGQSQPEISAVLHGRKILTYATLNRVAEGLGIPRGYLGLSWCERDCPSAPHP